MISYPTVGLSIAWRAVVCEQPNCQKFSQARCRAASLDHRDLSRRPSSDSPARMDRLKRLASEHEVPPLSADATGTLMTGCPQVAVIIATTLAARPKLMTSLTRGLERARGSWQERVAAGQLRRRATIKQSFAVERKRK